MRFVKMHGLGNDFIIIPDGGEVTDPARAARLLCHRRFGIGADGLVLLAPSARAAIKMRIYNADGSEAEMCGNALRCVVRYLDLNGLVRGAETAVETAAGIKQARLLPGGLLRVNMGKPVLDSTAVPVSGRPRRVIGEEISAGGETFSFTAVSMGNPHCVIFLEPGRTASPLKYGPLLERHPFFPRGTNVEFCRVNSPAEVTVEVWERGAGATMACGTGACAVVVAGVLQGVLQRKTLVRLPGGALHIEWLQGGEVYMEGPAAEVFTGAVDLDSIARGEGQPEQKL